MHDLILCGDIGGTKALLAIAEPAAAHATPLIHFQRRYVCADYAAFAPLFARFIADAHAAGIAAKQIRAGCLAIAGPIHDDGLHACMTNLPWEIDATTLAASHGCGPLRLVNDFVAAAAGIEAMTCEDLATLQAGVPLEHGRRLVVGAGTGLGMAGLIWLENENAGGTGGGYHIMPSEGGHCGFAPMNEEQAALRNWLAARLPDGRVTAEHVVSGPGLLAIYDFLSTRRTADTPDPRRASEPAAALAELAATQPASLARRAMDLFCAAYGAFAGDMALTLLAEGGVYIAGGIAARILPLLRASPFIACFNVKAGYAALTARIPVHIVTDARLGLKGAALLAIRKLPA